MANNENIPPSGTHDSQKLSDEKGRSRLISPLSIRTSNTLFEQSKQYNTAKSAPQVYQKTDQDSRISTDCPQDVPLPQSDDSERLLEPAEQTKTTLFAADDEPSDQINADLSDANSADDDDFSFDDSDMILDEDDNIPLDEDPFFGDSTAQIPNQITEEQLEEIKKALEEADAAQKTEDEMPVLEVDATAHADAILSEQNSSPKAIMVNIGSSFSKWIYLIVEPAESMFDLKLKFIQAADLAIEDLDKLEFLFDSRILEDDDTVQQLGIQQDSNIYCQIADATDRHNFNESAVEVMARRNSDEAMTDATNKPSSNRRSSSEPVAATSHRRNSNESAPWNWSM